MISERIVAAVNGIVPIYADDAETHNTPYATYSIDEELLYDKDGPSATRADVDILIVASTFDAADGLADDVVGSIGLLRSEMLVKLMSRQPYESPEAKLYSVQLSYQITEEIENSEDVED